ncbi:MAG: sugar ABC transporter substrate-binding protein [Proteobacteria bacterium]|nr:sugar ABC transporter substrate-binding protein [Pseudomonadota bacterium]MBS0573738.1 sugar ABC transporter substrate-binding protein [Pseudomonadota bacterium]
MSAKRYGIRLAAALTLATAAAPALAFDWKAQSGQEITVMVSENPWTNGLREHIAEFESQTGIKVNLSAFAEDLYSDRMNLAVRSTEPVADAYMVQMDSALFEQWKADAVEPLSPYIADAGKTDAGYDLEDYPAGFRQGASFPVDDPAAQLFAIPISFETYILFYNKDLVGKYLDGKVPATMDDLMAAAAKVSADGGTKDFGASMRGKLSAELVDTMTGIVFDAWGGDPIKLPENVWFDGDWTKPRFNDPKIAKGLSYYAGLLKAGPPSVMSYGWEDASRFFADGHAAFFVDASVFGPSFESPDSSKIVGKVGYAPLPPSAGDIGYSGHWSWGLSIPKNSQKKDAAWLFVQWATGKAMTTEFGKKTGGAPRLSSWADEGYKAALNPEYVAAVQTQMQHTRPTSVFREGWSEVVLQIVDTIQQIAGGADPQEAADALQEQLAGTFK